MALLWTSAAYRFQMAEHWQILTAVLIIWWYAGISLILYVWKQSKWPALIISAIMLLGFISYWWQVKPSLDRQWEPTAAFTVEGRINGNIAYIKNIRDFDWESPSHATIRWVDQSYDIDQITAIDLYLAYWMGPIIAHSLISLTFADGRHLVFSAEIRREISETYSILGGFFRKFELAMIAATEEDIIKLRTDIRREQVYRYSLRGTREMAKNLFISYITKANELAQKPMFYNTLTANCTTVIFDMAHVLDQSVPLDWRIVFSGQLPSYLFKHSFIDTSSPLDDIINDARVAPQIDTPRADYSRLIRLKPIID